MSVRVHLVTRSGVALAVPLLAIGMSSARAAVPAATAASAPAVSAAQAAAIVVPAPPRKSRLPAVIDVPMPYEAQVSCDGRDKPGVIAFATLMKAHYKTGTTSISRGCTGSVSEHYDGRALDWMLNSKVPQQKAVANSVVAWLSAGNGAVARRFGISYIIWNTKVWKGYAPERGWTAYTGSSPHSDHIHISFAWDGAMARTSWWTLKSVTIPDLGPCRVYAGQFAPLYRAPRTVSCPTNLPAPPRSPYPVYVPGQKHAHIAVAQRVLRVVATAQFAKPTYTALVAWQTRARVPVTGVLDKASWAKLVPVVPTVPAPTPPVTTPPAPKPPAATTPYTALKSVVLRQGSKGAAVVVLQRALKASADGAFGPKTRVALVNFQKLQRISPSGATNRVVWDRLEKRDHPLLAYRGLTLQRGSKGVAVVALQRALRVPATGLFALSTLTAVKAVQTSARLTPNGVVSGATWIAIEKRIKR